MAGYSADLHVGQIGPLKQPACGLMSQIMEAQPVALGQCSNGSPSPGKPGRSLKTAKEKALFIGWAIMISIVAAQAVQLLIK